MRPVGQKLPSQKSQSSSRDPMCGPEVKSARSLPGMFRVNARRPMVVLGDTGSAKPPRRDGRNKTRDRVAPDVSMRHTACPPLCPESIQNSVLAFLLAHWASTMRLQLPKTM